MHKMTCANVTRTSLFKCAQTGVLAAAHVASSISLFSTADLLDAAESNFELSPARVLNLSAILGHTCDNRCQLITSITPTFLQSITCLSHLSTARFVFMAPSELLLVDFKTGASDRRLQCFTALDVFWRCGGRRGVSEGGSDEPEPSEVPEEHDPGQKRPESRMGRFFDRVLLPWKRNIK